MTTESTEAMQQKLNTVDEGSAKADLKIHRRKTKLMKNIDITVNIHIDGSEVEKMTNYEYLGRTIITENRARNKILIRTTAGWKSIDRKERFEQNAEKSFKTSTSPLV